MCSSNIETCVCVSLVFVYWHMFAISREEFHSFVGDMKHRIDFFEQLRLFFYVLGGMILSLFLFSLDAVEQEKPVFSFRRHPKWKFVQVIWARIISWTSRDNHADLLLHLLHRLPDQFSFLFTKLTDRSLGCVCVCARVIIRRHRSFVRRLVRRVE